MSSTVPKKSVCYLLINNTDLFGAETHHGVKIAIVPLLLVVLEQQKDLGCGIQQFLGRMELVVW